MGEHGGVFGACKQPSRATYKTRLSQCAPQQRLQDGCLTLGTQQARSARWGPTQVRHNNHAAACGRQRGRVAHHCQHKRQQAAGFQEVGGVGAVSLRNQGAQLLCCTRRCGWKLCADSNSMMQDSALGVKKFVLVDALHQLQARAHSSNGRTVSPVAICVATSDHGWFRRASMLVVTPSSSAAALKRIMVPWGPGGQKMEGSTVMGSWQLFL